jgi:hypothetical protein
MRRTQRLSPAEINLIRQIVVRAQQMYRDFREEVPDALHLEATLMLVHWTYPMDLAALVDSSLIHFAHDIGGILRNWDVVSGTLRDGFTPRHCLMRGFGPVVVAN